MLPFSINGLLPKDFFFMKLLVVGAEVRAGFRFGSS